MPEPPRLSSWSPARACGAWLALGLFVLLATGPLLWRLTGIGAVVAERRRAGSWPSDHDLIFQVRHLASWMYRSNLDQLLWLGTVVSPMLLLIWLYLVPGTAMSGARFARLLKWGAALWPASLLAAILLGKLRLTGTF